MSIHRGIRAGRVNAPSGVGPFLLTIVFAAYASQAAAQIRPIDLGTLGGDYSDAVAVNASGQVAGTSTTTALNLNAEKHGFLWTAAGGMVDLRTLGGGESLAFAMNDSGQVAGTSTTGFGERHAFLWTRSVGMIDLGTLGGSSSDATAVSENGHVVGGSFTGDTSIHGLPVVHAFVWTPLGGMIDLGTLGGTNSWATAVNASGQVVGNSDTTDGESHPFSWTAAGGMIDLGKPGNNYCNADAVNSNGQVVGDCTWPGSGLHAFSWTAKGGMLDLGTFGGQFASGVNRSGQVVGSNFAGHPFLWTRAGGMIDLGVVPFGVGTPMGFARAVNERGQVAGTTFTQVCAEPPDNDICGFVRYRAFSWSAQDGLLSLATLGGDASYGMALNAKGQVVGSADTPQSTTHAVLWNVIAQTRAPVADAYVAAGRSASTNFGGATTLRSKKGIAADNTYRSYIKFDVSEINDGDRVTLRLHGNASNTTGPVKATVYAVDDTSWDEDTVTWNTRPALGTVLGSLTVNETARQCVFVDVTKFVQSERRAGRTVISLALRSVFHSSAFATFQSRESNDTGPRLVITR